MAKKVPPFHLRTIPAAIFDELWVKNTTTNEYEEVDKAGGEDIEVTWDDVADKPATFPPAIGTTATTAMAGNTPIPDAPDAVRLVPVVGTDNQVLKVVSGVPAWAADTNTTYTLMTQAVATAGTSTTANTINALVLKTTIDNALAPLIARIEALEAAEPGPDA